MSVPSDSFSLEGKDSALTPELRLVVDHLRAGRQQQAKALLARHVIQHPESEQGWFLLSFAVSDPRQQIECLQRALAINPGNTAAGARLTRLRSAQQPLKPEPGRASPAPAPRPASPQKASRPPVAAPPKLAVRPSASAARPSAPAEPMPAWMPPDAGIQAPPADLDVPKERKKRGGCGRLFRAFLVVSLIFLAIGALGALALALFAYLSVSRPVAVPTPPVLGPATLPPTWTPTASPAPTLTPTITITPTLTPTRTPVSPEPTTAAAMDQIGREVADLRGLPVVAPVMGFLLPEDDVRPVLEASFLASGGTQAELDDEARVLSALGLIKPTYNLYTNSLNSLTDSLGGFYFPWNQQLYVIGNRFSGVERWVFSHEFAHALVDQHYKIGDMGVYPVCESTLDRCTAVRALVEGDATLVMAQWWKQYASPKDSSEIASYSAPPQTLPEQYPPDYLIQQSQFPYVSGLKFVNTLHQRGNWAEVNKAFQRLPESTEQILHPEMYLARESPVKTAAPDLASLLDESWRKLDEDTLGEWGTYLLLGYGADLEAQIDPARAESAARGWGGDAYQVYYRDADGSTLMAALWTWDASGEAGAFTQAMEDHLDARFRGGETDQPASDCWAANAQLTCLFTSGRQTLWILAPDARLLQDVRALYPGFS